MSNGLSQEAGLSIFLAPNVVGPQLCAQAEKSSHAGTVRAGDAESNVMAEVY